MIRVLIFEYVTGGGMAAETLQPEWLAEGEEMRAAAIREFAEAGCEVVTLQDARLPIDLPVDHHSVASQAELRDRLSQMLAETDHAVLIAPETGGALAELATFAENRAGWNLGCTPHAIAQTGDKLLFSRHLHNHQINHPRTWAASTFEEQWPKTSGPLIVKPVDGAGSLDTFKINSRNELKHIITTSPERFLIQKFAHGQSMSLSVLADGDGGFEPVGICRHQVDFQVAGEGVWSLSSHVLQSGEPEIMSRLENVRKALSSLPGLLGWVGVDFLWNDATGVDTVIEINPRLTFSFCVLAGENRFGGLMARKWLSTASRALHSLKPPL